MEKDTENDNQSGEWQDSGNEHWDRRSFVRMTLKYSDKSTVNIYIYTYRRILTIMVQRLTDMARVVERWIRRGGFRQLSVRIGRLTSISTMSCIERKLTVHFTPLNRSHDVYFEWPPSNSRAGFVG